MEEGVHFFYKIPGSSMRLRFLTKKMKAEKFENQLKTWWQSACLHLHDKLRKGSIFFEKNPSASTRLRFLTKKMKAEKFENQLKTW